MNTCAVTIAGPDRRVDLVVSTETPIADLIPTFVELSMDEAPAGNGRAPVWTVTPPGQQPLPLDRTLGQCGVSDGSVLTLTEIRSQAMAPPSPAEVVRRPEVHRGSPRERTAGALPEELTGGERLSLAMKAFFGYEPEPPITESPEPASQTNREVLTKPEQRSATERFKASWRESEYEARLDRLIADAAAHALRHDRGRLAEGRRGEDHPDRAARLAARPRAARPHRGGRHEPGLRLARAHADPRPPGLRGRPQRRARAARPLGHGSRSPPRAAPSRG